MTGAKIRKRRENTKTMLPPAAVNICGRRLLETLMDGNTQQTATSGGRYAFLVLFLVLMSALGSFVNDMFTPSLPAMCRFFHTTIPTVQLGLTAGMVGLALGQFILGPVSDHVGRKPVLVVSVSLFIVAAVVSVFSPTINFFICCRLFQGIGASGGYFLARTMPADLYSGRALARLMGLIGAINGIAPASAPVLGGITSDAFGWKGVFVVLAGFALIILLLSPFVRESLPEERRTQVSVWKSFGGYRDLLRNRRFMIHVSFKGLALGVLFAYISAAPFILQNHYGLSQTSYGLVIGFNSLFVVSGAMLSLRFHPLKKAAYTGSIILAGGIVAQAVSLWLVHSIYVYEACMCVMLFGLGLIFSTTNSLAMNEGRVRAGEASSILGISGYVVGAVVAPLVGVGNVLHSTAIVFLCLGAAVMIFSLASRRLSPDLDAPSAPPSPASSTSESPAPPAEK